MDKKTVLDTKRVTRLLWITVGVIIGGIQLGSLGGIHPAYADDDESPQRVVRFRTAQSKLTRLQNQNLYQSVFEAATLADVKKLIRQPPTKITILAPPKKTEKNKKRLRQMVFIRQDQYIFKARKPEDDDKSLTVLYRRVMRAPSDLDKNYREFKDQEWLFIEFVAKDKLPPRFSRLDKDGNLIRKDKKNPGDKPSAAGGGRPQQKKTKQTKKSLDSKTGKPKSQKTKSKNQR